MTLAEEFEKVFTDTGPAADKAFDKWSDAHHQDILGQYGDPGDEHGQLMTFSDGSAIRIEIKDGQVVTEVGSFTCEKIEENNNIH